MEDGCKLSFLLNLAKFNAKMYRKLDASLGGIGFNDFIILFNLSKASDQKMRRIDLADKVGLTASGITRLLLPMEKIGLVSREINEFDARVSYVVLANGGKTKLNEALERVELLFDDMIPNNVKNDFIKMNKLLLELNKNF